jgi:hypothetical protein
MRHRPMTTTYPMSEAQIVRSAILTEQGQPTPKRTAREIAEERWFGPRSTVQELIVSMNNDFTVAADIVT